MDDATAARFALIEAGLAGVFEAMAGGERAEVAGGCPRAAVGRSLRVGEYDCFLCRTFDWWAPLASPAWVETESAPAELLTYAADTLAPRGDAAAGRAYPGDTRGRISACRQIAGWLRADGPV